jgi:hypothetical protein
MKNTTWDKAKEKALQDWSNKTVTYLFNGRWDLESPLLKKGDIFYPQCYPIQTEEDEMFCNAYNEAISQLVSDRGVPDWAPVNLIPEREQALKDLFCYGQSIDNYKFQSIKERNLVSSIIRKWGASKPSLWCRLVEKNLLLLGGDISTKVSRVDILDIKSMRWLARFEYLRKHCPEMPWDGIS